MYISIYIYTWYKYKQYETNIQNNAAIDCCSEYARKKAGMTYHARMNVASLH